MKLKISLFTIFVLLILPSLTAAQEPLWLTRLKQMEWMGKVSQLKLLKTTRDEAEKILGAPDKSKLETDYYKTYTLSPGEIALDYTDKECSSIDGIISKDTIKEIRFEPEVDIPLQKLVSKLKIPIKLFNHSGSDVVGSEFYESDYFGVYFGTFNKKLSSITFIPSENRNYRCISVPSFLSELEKIKKIKLLETNRDEVRRMFAGYELSKDSPSNKDVFVANSTRIKFTYSDDRCEFENSDGYDTPEGNVIGIEINPYYYLYPKELGVNLTQLTKEKIYQNVAGSYVFHDKEKGLSFETYQGKISLINFFPSSKFYPLMCNRKKSKILSSTNSLFEEKLKARIYKEEEYLAFIKSVGFNRKEIILNCNSSKTVESKICVENNQQVKVFAEVINPREKNLTYNYTVSGGKIIGRGAKVIWDLSGVKPGTYSIIVAVDEGCGFCAKTMTKTVVVKECSDCPSP